MPVSLLSNDSQLSETKVQAMTQPVFGLTGDHKSELSNCIDLLCVGMISLKLKLMMTIFRNKMPAAFGSEHKAKELRF